MVAPADDFDLTPEEWADLGDAIGEQEPSGPVQCLDDLVARMEWQAKDVSTREAATLTLALMDVWRLQEGLEQPSTSPQAVLAPRVLGTPALNQWRVRKGHVFDDLWRAACWEQSALDAERQGFSGLADRYLRTAREILPHLTPVFRAAVRPWKARAAR